MSVVHHYSSLPPPGVLCHTTAAVCKIISFVIVCNIKACLHFPPSFSLISEFSLGNAHYLDLYIFQIDISNLRYNFLSFLLENKQFDALQDISGS